MKKTLSLLCASTMAVSLTACGTTQTDSNPDYAYATVTGQVTAIDGNSVTLQLGTLSAASGSGQTPPEAAQGGNNSDSSSDAQTPPEKPAGDSSSDPSNSGDSAQQEMPSGNGGDMGSAPGGMGSGQSFTAGEFSITVDLSDASITMNSDSATVSDLSTDDVVTLTFDGNGAVAAAEVVNLNGSGMGGAPGGMGGGSSTVEQGDSANTINEDSTVSDTTYTSTGDDENALRVDGATVTLSGITVDKSAGASSNVESGDFYGMNAALLATNGATITIEDAIITSSAQNGNGVFSYGTDTTVNIANSTITTTADNSGGIQTTGGGTTNATNLTVDTSGNSAAAIRSDRGGGTVDVNEGTYTSNGYNSPAVYSTAAITVKNATLTANNSEALVIEGQNSITLEDCDVTGNMSDTNGTSSDENVHNVMIYQSMSGDAEVGTSSFSMTGGTLTGKNGDMFFITNTDCTLYLSGVSITNEDSDGNLMTITGNSASRGWGTAGKNGAQVAFTADNQVLSGNIVVDSISTLDMTLTNGSDFTGTINITDNDEGGTAVDNNAVVTIDSGCTWTLTGNCTITSLTNNGTINFNGYTITLADGTVLS